MTKATIYKQEPWPGHPFPWRFRIEHDGRTLEFAGIPNQCATRRQATARAAWRVRWLKGGTFNGHYRDSTETPPRQAGATEPPGVLPDGCNE